MTALKIVFGIAYLFAGLGFAMRMDALTDCHDRQTFDRVINAVSGIAFWPIPTGMRLGELVADPTDVKPFGCARRR